MRKLMMIVSFAFLAVTGFANEGEKAAPPANQEQVAKDSKAPEAGAGTGAAVAGADATKAAAKKDDGKKKPKK